MKVIIIISKNQRHVKVHYADAWRVCRSERTAYWVGVRRLMLMHCALDVCMFSLFSARNMCFEL